MTSASRCEAVCEISGGARTRAPTLTAHRANVHGRTDFTVRLAVDDHEVVVEVQDGNPRTPERSGTHQPEALSGRGLHIIDAVTSAWGTRPEPPGKVVWAHVPVVEIWAI